MSEMATRPEHALVERLRSAPTPLALLQQTAAARPDHPALVFLRDPLDREPRIVRYAELATKARAAAVAFREAGVERGDSVALLLPCIPEGVAALIGATAAGIAFPANLLFASDALAAQLELARARVAVVLGSHPALDVKKRLLAAARAYGQLSAIVEVPVGESEADTMSWTSFLEETGSCDVAQTDSDRVAALFHTGGTTGLPKLAELSAKNLVVGGLMTAAAIGWRPQDRVLSGLPLFHVAGAIDVVLGAIAAGATLIFPGYLGARDPAFVQNVWSIVERTQATILGLVPTSIAAVMDTPLGDSNLETLRALITGGSALSPYLAGKIEQLIGRPVSQVYGMTETAGIVAAQPTDGVFRAPAVGFPAPMVTLSIGSPGDVHARKGEVFVKGPNVFRGYRTAGGLTGAPQDGWVASGDLGEYASDGQLRLLGRSKDVIIRSGHNIDPLLIEEAAQLHPDVRQAGAVPIPDEYAGELPALFVALRSHASTSPQAIAAFVAERIAEPPAQPKHIFILSELPLTPFGKVARFKLRQLAAQARAAEVLQGFPIERVECSDATGKRIDVVWKNPPDSNTRQRAGDTLARLGLVLAS